MLHLFSLDAPETILAWQQNTRSGVKENLTPTIALESQKSIGPIR
jgi:hypothetical protein